MGTGRARSARASLVRIAKWFAALVVGAFVPAGLVAYALGAAGVLPPAFAITLGHALILGVPMALFYRRRQWRSPAYALAGGFLIGSLPAGLYFWPLDPRPGTDVWTGATQTLADGVPTWAGWVEYLQMLSGFGCLGALGALAFWLTLKMSGELRPQ
jgi:hypothetical protein